MITHHTNNDTNKVSLCRSKECERPWEAQDAAWLGFTDKNPEISHLPRS
jgi:hypothetical protein